jgi:hypothetical protein
VGVDRYGFFSPTSGDRLVLLPSAPFTRALSYARTSPPSGALPTAPSIASLPSRNPTPEDRKREDRRVQKWGRMLVPRQPGPGGDISNWTVNSRKEGKFVNRVYKGVPDRWRSAAWWILTERRASASFQAGATRELAFLGRQYRVSTRLVGYKHREVLMGNRKGLMYRLRTTFRSTLMFLGRLADMSCSRPGTGWGKSFDSICEYIPQIVLF